MENSDQKRSANFSFMTDTVPFFSSIPGGGTLCSQWRTLARRGLQLSYSWWALLFSFLSYLIVELSIPDRELWPEVERKLLIHDGLCSSLLFRTWVELSIPDGKLWPEEECKLLRHDWYVLVFSFLYLKVELSIPDGELWSEEERKLLIYDGLCSLLLFYSW